MSLRSLFCIGVVVTISGCASIVGGSNQTVSVETRFKGKPVAGAQCELRNPKGTYFLTSPGTVNVNRAYDDLSIKCEKDGFEPGILTAKSSTKGMAFGNIIFGGIIGGAVDMSTGAAYDYPPIITVVLGENLTLTPPTEEKK